MWCLTQKKNKLWIKWIHTYYLKGKQPWEVQDKQASWTVQKILQAGKWLDKTEKWTIKKVYRLLRGQFEKVAWRRLMCNNLGCPSWTFILSYLGKTLHKR